MEGLLLALLYPLIHPWIVKRIWHTTINWQEMLLNIIIPCLLVAIVWEAGIHSKMTDVEIWNGQVTEKYKDSVSCEHDYVCNCSTDSNGNESCSTCYEHFRDYDWVVKSTAGDFLIDRIDEQGDDLPPRFAKIQVGEPVSREHGFDNYIKAVPNSLFNTSAGDIKRFVNLIPQYPRVYDYQKVNRVLTMGVGLPNAKEWNDALAMKLRELGPKRQANIIVVMVNSNDPAYTQALESAWLGGKKNDIIVVVGVTAYPAIDWVGIVSWTDSQLFKVQLRDDLMNVKTLDMVKILDTIDAHTKSSFVRKKMKDFEYLKDEIDPPDWVIILAVLISILGSIGLSVLFHRVDVDFFNNSKGRRRR